MDEQQEKTESMESEQTLSKEEILARSRKENEKNGDEREQAKWKWVTYSGYLAMIITVVVIEFCYILLHQAEPFFYPIYVLLGTGMSAQTTCQAVVMKKGRGKTISIVCAVVLIAVTIALWVLFALSLAGIEL